MDNFKVGDEVEWSSQAAGSWKTKRGRVVEVVEPKEFNAGPGYRTTRSVRWYIVNVNGKLYYPNSGLLRRPAAPATEADRISALERQVAELAAERDAAVAKLGKRLSEQIDEQSRFLRSGPGDDGSFEFLMVSPAVKVILAVIAEMFKRTGAKNYIHQQIELGTGSDAVIVSLQRKQGKTPTQIIAELAAERDAARAEAQQLALDAAEAHDEAQQLRQRAEAAEADNAAARLVLGTLLTLVDESDRWAEIASDSPLGEIVNDARVILSKPTHGDAIVSHTTAAMLTRLTAAEAEVERLRGITNQLVLALKEMVDQYSPEHDPSPFDGQLRAHEMAKAALAAAEAAKKEAE